MQTYGSRARFGPYTRQAVRFVGRSLEQLGVRLDTWSWGWTPRESVAERLAPYSHWRRP
jgi:hypothetical protein